MCDYLFMIIVVLFTVLFYVWYLFKTPLVYGIDEPYYLIQIRSIAETGAMAYGDPQLTFYYLYLLYLLLGDMFPAVKVGVIIAIVLTGITMYLFTYNLTGRNLVVASASTLYFILSPNLIRLSGDFVKNTVGLLFFVLYLYFLLQVLRNKRPGIKWFGLSVLMLILCYLTHVLDYGFALAATLVVAVLVVVKSILYNKEKLFTGGTDNVTGYVIPSNILL